MTLAFSKKLNLILSIGLAFLSIECRADDPSKTVQFLNHTVSEPYRLNTANNQFAIENIKRGLAVLDQLLTETYQNPSDSSEYMKDIFAMNWALFHLAVDKNQGFEQGSFVIEDPHYKLFSFLKNYEEVRKRSSSHLSYIKKLTGVAHYGIDVLGTHQTGAIDWMPYSGRGKLNQYVNSEFKQMNILPSNKGHILFGQIPATEKTSLQSNHLFLKIEDNGLRTWSGYFGHALDLFESLHRRFIQGETHEEIARRERLDGNLKKLYAEVLKVYPEAIIEDLTQSVLMAPQVGVREMLSKIRRLALNADQYPALSEAVNNFMDALENKEFDHIESRTGSEVLFTEDELKNSVSENLALIQNQDLQELDESESSILMPLTEEMMFEEGTSSSQSFSSQRSRLSQTRGFRTLSRWLSTMTDSGTEIKDAH